MTQTVKRLSALPLMAVLLCSTHSPLEAKKHGWDWGTFLVGAGCAAVAGAVGCAVYNACQSPSDSEELGSGQCLLSNARSLQAKCASRYHADCTMLASTDQLKHSILRNSSRRSPYTSYVAKLRHDISHTQSTINDLIGKKNHLFECKMELSSNKNLSHEERVSYSEQYDSIIEQLGQQIDTLQAMCNDLRNLEVTIVAFPEYREEQLVEQINNLQDRIDHMNYHVCAWTPATPYWYEPAVVHYEPTIVLHGDVTPIIPAPQPTSNWGVGVSYAYSE